MPRPDEEEYILSPPMEIDPTLQKFLDDLLFEMNVRLKDREDYHRDAQTEGRNVYMGPNGLAEVAPGTDINTYISIISKSGDYTVLDDDGVSVITVDASSAAVTITLPTAADNEGRVLHIKKIDSSANNVTVDGEGSETIDDQTTQTISAQYDDMRIVCDSNEWWIL